MSKPKFTPGEWASVRGNMAWRVVAGNVDVASLCLEHDATLISAAPDLYAVCECQEAINRCDAPGTEYTRNQLDAVLARHGIEHVTRTQAIEYIAKLRREALKKANP